MAIIVPTGLALQSLLGACVLPIVIGYTLIQFFAEFLIIYGLLELVRWVFQGRPPLSEHLKTSFPSRRLYATFTVGSESKPRICGASGLLEAEDAEEDDVDNRLARPLKGVGDFFRSRSPLNDLLVTFESTRGWVEPISFQRMSDAEDGSIVESARDGDLEQGRLRKLFSIQDSKKDLGTGVTEKT
jgi:hypothetical protein